jgi:fatty-acyl-CoA synthase
LSSTVRDRVLAHHRRHPERVYVRCVDAGGASETVTYRRLVERGSQLAAAMAAAGSPPGALVVVILPHSPDLYCALFGAILGGRVPTLLAVPSFKIDPAYHARELEALAVHLGASVLVTDSGTAAQLDLTGPALSRARVLLVDRIAPAPAAVPDVRVGADDLAVLQHSSGSTGLKKGVALTHRAVLHQIDAYAAALGLRSEDRIASWLPLYHDMGLVACALMPALMGVPVTALGPLHWVTRPASLLRVVAEDRCTLAWMPNFAFDFLSARVRDSQIDEVFLASMRAWINCSEPTLAETHRRFLRRYAGRGVRPEHLWTCYAAAETTFAITQSSDRVPPLVEHLRRDDFLGRGLAIPVERAPGPTVEVMSAGVPLSGTEVRIVDEAGGDLPDRHVGEIAVRSDSVFRGYFRRPDITARVLRDGWYHSGDLGYRAGGHLFVTGRKNDLIIIAGRNYYPQDVERIVGEVAGIHDGRSVALGVDDPAIGTQRLVVLAEVDDPALVDSPELRSRVREAVAARLDCTISDLRLLPRRWLLKTSSGKIARAPNLARYLRELAPSDPDGG